MKKSEKNYSDQKILRNFRSIFLKIIKFTIFDLHFSPEMRNQESWNLAFPNSLFRQFQVPLQATVGKRGRGPRSPNVHKEKLKQLKKIFLSAKTSLIVHIYTPVIAEVYAERIMFSLFHLSVLPSDPNGDAPLGTL